MIGVFLQINRPEFLPMFMPLNKVILYLTVELLKGDHG